MDYFCFGKYKGQRVLDIIKKDPEYVAWCNLNTKIFSLDEYQKNYLSECVDRKYLSKKKK